MKQLAASRTVRTMASTGPQRIAQSRKTAAGRVTTRQQSGKSGSTVTSVSPQNSTGNGGPNTEPNQTATVVLEMIDTEKNHPNHPTLVGKFLRERGYLDCTEITKLGKFRFKVDTKSEAGLRRLNLAEINLRPYEPKNRNHTIAFVRGVPESFAEEEMLDNSEAEYQVIQVQRIKRRDRNGGLQDTTNIKVTVEGTQVPKWLKIYGCNFRPELYIFPIRQCQNCWRFGHGAKFCTARARCGTCGGNHPTRECNTDAKCPNCRSQHSANDPGCPERKRHVKIREKMREKQISYAQAETQYPKLQNRFNLLEELEEEEGVGFPTLQEYSHRKGPTGGRGPQKGQAVSNPRGSSRERTEHSENAMEVPPQHIERRTTCPNCRDNPLKATEFERFISWLRKEFLAEKRSRRWIEDLQVLQQKIARKAQHAKSELERDQLLVEIGQDIQAIIEGQPTPEKDIPRSNTGSHSGV